MPPHHGVDGAWNNDARSGPIRTRFSTDEVTGPQRQGRGVDRGHDLSASVLEVFVVADVLRVFHEEEADVFAALVASGKCLPRDAGDLVGLGVLAVVRHAVDSGLLYLLARFK